MPNPCRCGLCVCVCVFVVSAFALVWVFWIFWILIGNCLSHWQLPLPLACRFLDFLDFPVLSLVSFSFSSQSLFNVLTAVSQVMSLMAESTSAAVTKCAIVLKTPDQYDIWRARVADACWSATAKRCDR